jgi:hypothetical protein
MEKNRVTNDCTAITTLPVCFIRIWVRTRICHQQIYETDRRTNLEDWLDGQHHNQPWLNSQIISRHMEREEARDSPELRMTWPPLPRMRLNHCHRAAGKPRYMCVMFPLLWRAHFCQTRRDGRR